MTSKECLNYKNKYSDVKYKIQHALGYFDDCSSSLLKTSSFLQELIIDGKTFDDDKLNEDNSKLSDAKNNLLSIINECDEKINYYEKLYKEAVARERALANSSSNSSDSAQEEVSTIKAPVKSIYNHRVDMR